MYLRDREFKQCGRLCLWSTYRAHPGVKWEISLGSLHLSWCRHLRVLDVILCLCWLYKISSESSVCDLTPMQHIVLSGFISIYCKVYSHAVYISLVAILSEIPLKIVSFSAILTFSHYKRNCCSLYKILNTDINKKTN